MSSSLREHIDKTMNCDDIAVNYLIAHITGKPPIKVTARLDFRCPECPVGLSKSPDHYTEGSKCLGFFNKIYGYNPLKRTQYRADTFQFKAGKGSSAKVTYCVKEDV